MASPLVCSVGKSPTRVSDIQELAAKPSSKPAQHGVFMLSVKRPRSLSELIPVKAAPKGLKSAYGCRLRSVVSVLHGVRRGRVSWGFRIQATAANGDCFFDALSQATLGTSKPFTIPMLKHVLADAIIARSAAVQVQEFVMRRLKSVKSLKDVKALMADLRDGHALRRAMHARPAFFEDSLLTALRVSAAGGVSASKSRFQTSGLRMRHHRKAALRDYVSAFKRRGGMWVIPDGRDAVAAAARHPTLDPSASSWKDLHTSFGPTGLEQYFGTWREMLQGDLSMAWMALRQDVAESKAPFYATDRELGLLGDALNIAFIVVESSRELDITVRFPDGAGADEVKFVCLFHHSGDREAQWGAHYELVEFCPELADDASAAYAPGTTVTESMWSWASLPKALQIAVLTKGGERTIKQGLKLHRPDRTEFVSDVTRLTLPRVLGEA